MLYGAFAVERNEKETGRANDSFHDFDDVFAPVGSGPALLDIPVLAVPGQVWRTGQDGLRRAGPSRAG